MLKTEIRRLTSQHLSGASMYPGVWRFTWFKAPGMPWALVSIEQVQQ